MNIDLAVFGWVALGAAVITEAVKQAVPVRFHNFVPIALTLLLSVLTGAYFYLQGLYWVDGAVHGIVAAGGAVFGWSFLIKTVRGVKELRDEAA